MALINITSLLTDTIRALKNIQHPGGIELLSYKRNRGIAILRLAGKGLEIIENGYIYQRVMTEDSELQKIIKPMIKREFPRSRKVRLVKLSHPDELDRKHQKI